MKLEKQTFRVQCRTLSDSTVLVAYVKAVDCLEACHNTADLFVAIGVMIEQCELFIED